MSPVLPFPMGAITLDRLVEEQSDIVRELHGLDLIATASTFGGLLLSPELHPNCLRLELLVHLATACCAGSKHPTRGFVVRAFERLGHGFCGRAEDPSLSNSSRNS